MIYKELAEKYVKMIDEMQFKIAKARLGLEDMELTKRQVDTDLIILKQTIQKDFKIKWFEEK